MKGLGQIDDNHRGQTLGQGHQEGGGRGLKLLQLVTGNLGQVIPQIFHHKMKREEFLQGCWGDKMKRIESA